MYYIKTIKKNKGFTLIELLLYISISSIMLITVSFFLSMIIESRIKNQTIAEVEQQGLQVMQIIQQTIRNAETINLPAIGIRDNTLSLDVITITDDPTIFNLSNNIIYITEGTSSSIALTNSKVLVSNLSFFNLSRLNTPGVVRIAFTITYNNNIGRNEYNFSKTFYANSSLRYPQ